MINPVINVKEGKLRGCVEKLHNGQEYYSFKGIPYAEPPVGDLRFKAPIPPKPWSGTRDALEHGPNCPHFDIFSVTGENVDENCLFLNVYTPTLQTDSKLPVMFFIHGGDVDPVNRAFRVGKFLGKDTDNPNELLTYLQSLPSKKLVSLTMKTATKEEKTTGLPIKFVPVVEKKFGDNEVFLPENPLDMLMGGKTHDIPFMTGYNSSEGFLIVPNELPKLAYINKHPACLVPKDIYNKVSKDKVLEFGARIKQFYWGDRDLTKDDIQILTDLLSDVHFIVAAYRYASYYSKYNTPIYMYRFNLVTELNWTQQMLGLTEYKGACHFDDIFYMFSNGMNREKYEKSPILQEYIHNITKIWTDFAKTGNPTPDNSLGVTWSPYTSTGKEYLQIDNELSMGRNAEKTRLDFWDQLYTEAGLPSIIKSNL
ncbi:unnamed protein product [Danaus chrysippus]|uniref:(African queen) hypothetical protein n=1 Tax=Danaus chrysippus TaxID=151541 RepID=A0A8J2VW97_9NEOP|nr:unnamed protein product [Danaus chrysippus]